MRRTRNTCLRRQRIRDREFAPCPVETTRVEGFFVLLKKGTWTNYMKKETTSEDPLISIGILIRLFDADRERKRDERIEKSPLNMVARST